jgi:hypothetical protein
MPHCPVEDCTKIKEVKTVLDKKISLKELSIAACVVTVCIASVVTVYGYVVGGSLASVVEIREQIIETKIMAKENRVEIINLKNSFLSRTELKAIVTEAVREANR